MSTFCRTWLRFSRNAAASACCWTLVLPPTASGQDAIRLQRVTGTTSDRLKDLAVVADATMDPQGRVFILDRIAPRVVVTDAHLRLIGYAGRRGSGPGEFREPVSIAIGPDRRVAVLDRALRRVTVFDVRGDTALVAWRTVSIRTPSESMCVLKDGTFLVYGLTGGNRLHVVDLDARLLRSFGPPDVKLSPMAQDQLAQGRITCDLPGDEVLVSSRFLPTVEVFRISTGARVWADTLHPFRALAVTDRGGSVTLSSGRAGFSLITSLFIVGDYRVFQTTYEARLDSAGVDTVVTYVYSGRARNWLPLQFDLPVLFPLRGGMTLSVTPGDQLAISLHHMTVGGEARSRPRRGDG